MPDSFLLVESATRIADARMRVATAGIEAHPVAARLPPARMAVNTGPLIARDADFFGRTVNVAARLVDYSRPREVLVTGAVVESTDAEDISFEKIGPVSLKGVPEPVMVFSAHRR